jgi:hypothetical protein
LKACFCSVEHTCFEKKRVSIPALLTRFEKKQVPIPALLTHFVKKRVCSTL